MQTIANSDNLLLDAYSPVHLHVYVGNALIPCKLGSFTMTSSVGSGDTGCGNSIASSIQFVSLAEPIIRALSTHAGEVLETHDSQIIVSQFQWKELTGTPVRITWDVDGATEYNLFIGKIEKTVISGGRVTISAQDELFWNGSKAFSSQSSYQTDSNASTVFNAIASIMGVSADSTTSTLLSSITISGGFSSCRDTLTCYQAAGYIAGLVGGNAVISRDGKLKIVKYTESGFSSEPYLGECSAENYDYIVSGVSFIRNYIQRSTNPDGTISESEVRTVYKAGNGSLQYENPLSNQESATRAYSALASFASRKGTYTIPMGIQLEPGDLITIQSMDGTYPVAINQLTFSIDGGVKTTIQGAGQSNPDGINGTIVGQTRSGSTVVEDGTEVPVPGRAGPLTQRVESLELELLKVKNLQAENAEITNANIQSLHAGNIDVDQLFAQDITATGSFQVNNDAWRLVQDNDGCTIATKELNALSQDPVGEFKLGSSYGYIACNHVNNGNVFYRAMVLVNAEIGKVSIECGNAHADFEDNVITIGNQDGGLGIFDGKFSVYATSGIGMGNNVYPADYGVEASGVYSLGKSNARWTTVYLTSNPNVSSDRNVKRDITEEVPDIVDGLVPVSYRRKGGSDRIHYGFIAQDVEQALLDSNVDTNDIGLVTYDTDGNGAKRNYALSYDELIPILVAKIQNQQKQIDALSERLDRLEKGVK